MNNCHQKNIENEIFKRQQTDRQSTASKMIGLLKSSLTEKLSHIFTHIEVDENIDSVAEFKAMWNHLQQSSITDVRTLDSQLEAIMELERNIPPAASDAQVHDILGQLQRFSTQRTHMRQGYRYSRDDIRRILIRMLRDDKFGTFTRQVISD